MSISHVKENLIAATALIEQANALLQKSSIAECIPEHRPLSRLQERTSQLLSIARSVKAGVLTISDAL